MAIHFRILLEENNEERIHLAEKLADEIITSLVKVHRRFQFVKLALAKFEKQLY